VVMVMEDQAVSQIQLNQLTIEWVPLKQVRPNSYNPNKMTFHDRMLLRQSLLEDGWTQPIVTLKDGAVIVDGEQRWAVAGLGLHPSDIQEVIDKMESRKAQGHPESNSILERLHDAKARLEEAITGGEESNLAAITGGLVPITRLDLGDEAHKVISTIRHNRARGIHQIDAMAGLTRDLVELGLDLDDLEMRLGMDDEEIRRFLQQTEGQIGDLMDDLEGTDYSQAWGPVKVTTLTDNEVLAKEIERSQQAAVEAKDYQLKLKARRDQINAQAAQIVTQREEHGEVLTQSDKDDVAAQVEKSIDAPEPPPPIQARKLAIVIAPEEHDMIMRLVEIMGEGVATTVVEACKAELERRGG